MKADHAARVRADTIDSGRFTAATVAYWFEWFAVRRTFPPDAATAVAWIREREDSIGRALDELPDSWIPADPDGDV